MDKRVIPADAHRAALRGFIRTASQSLSAAIPVTGISVYLTSDWAQSILLGIIGAVLSALLAGFASYFSILSKGIPEDYLPELPYEPKHKVDDKGSPEAL